MNRQKLLLLILLGGLVVALIYAFWQTPRTQRVAVGARGGEPALQGGVGNDAAEKYRVRLELLERNEGRTPEVRRNLFGPLYVVKAPPPPPPPPPVKKLPPPPPAQPKALPKPKPPVKKLPPLASFSYLGFMELREGKVVFLASGDEVFAVKSGEPFGEDGKFSVVDLTEETLRISQGDDPRLISVSLAEKASSPGAGEGRKGDPVFRMVPFPKPLIDPSPGRTRSR
ncbi:MAG: hypothetical protein C0617_12760 [Desulfuromonas sp.]|uniref:hypothetical protein n=1 Tax=Desulfuromonas sp. TaxID=892 RepID=UPI000CC25D40|nr:hypothetical protein [Desulfuromonas sp.]PLX83102.1 MAG: hypothetical protein C0617_12760 [Desulfuromonas sp.]